MMILISELKPWFGLLLAFFATFLWRFLGLVLAERISSTGSLMCWINAIAYSMVAGVLMIIITNPTGILSSSSLLARLFGLSFGIVAVLITKNILFSIIVGVIAFVFFTKI